MLAGSGARSAGLGAVARAIAGVSELAVELRKHTDAPDADRASSDRTAPSPPGAGSSAPNDPCCQLIAPAGSSA
jgi:hypothetical protein